MLPLLRGLFFGVEDIFTPPLVVVETPVCVCVCVYFFLAICVRSWPSIIHPSVYIILSMFRYHVVPVMPLSFLGRCPMT